MISTTGRCNVLCFKGGSFVVPAYAPRGSHACTDATRIAHKELLLPCTFTLRNSIRSQSRPVERGWFLPRIHACGKSSRRKRRFLGLVSYENIAFSRGEKVETSVNKISIKMACYKLRGEVFSSSERIISSILRKRGDTTTYRYFLDIFVKKMK